MNKSKVREMKWISIKFRECNLHFSQNNYEKQSIFKELNKIKKNNTHL